MFFDSHAHCGHKALHLDATAQIYKNRMILLRQNDVKYDSCDVKRALNTHIKRDTVLN